MNTRFRNDPNHAGYFAPMRFEADVFDCEVEGRIPSELDAARPSEGDIARIRLPFRAHPQVHGWWVDARQLPLGDPG